MKNRHSKPAHVLLFWQYRDMPMSTENPKDSPIKKKCIFSLEKSK